jgi:zinc protease
MVERLYNGMLNDRFNEMSRQSNPPFLGASSARGDLIRTKGAYMLSAAVLENGIQRGLEALLIEAERVAQFGFTESELEREKAAAMRGMERTYTNRVNRSGVRIRTV